MKSDKKRIHKSIRGRYSKDLKEADRNSRLRNSKKFTEVEKDDLINSVNNSPDKSGNSRNMPNIHYGGDKYGGATHNHSGKNWGFGSGVNDENDTRMK